MNFLSLSAHLLNNSSVLPSRKTFKTNKRLHRINIKEDGILKIISSLDVNKDHGRDDFSIRVLKTCESVVTQPLTIIFKTCIQCGIIPDIWKVSQVILIHQKNDKGFLNN